MKTKHTPEEIAIAIREKIISIKNDETYLPFARVFLYFLKRELKRFKK